MEKVIGSMQTEEAENSGDSIPLSTRGAFRFSAMIEKTFVFILPAQNQTCLGM